MFQRRQVLVFSLTLVVSLFSMLESRGFSQDDQAAGANVELLTIFQKEFVEITPGKGKFPESFQMGSETGPATEQPQHKVTLAKPFAIAKYEVPQNLFEAVTGSNPSRWKGKRNSTEMMTFAQAIAFCKKATTQMRALKLIGADEEIRLPTEAEWEYCCRAGTTTAYSFGDEATAANDIGNLATKLNDFAWHTGNAAGNDPEVGVLKPNPWGLYDMHGYLWEYVSDEWHEDYKQAPEDGSSWTSPENNGARVLRSGSWKDRYPSLRSSARRKLEATEKGDEIGFRCVKAKVIIDN